MVLPPVEIKDALFCAEHFNEVCSDCSFDGREDNDTFYGFDPQDREPLSLDTPSTNKAGEYLCKKHSNAGCSQCFGWKKQLTKLHKDAKKAGK